MNPDAEGVGTGSWVVVALGSNLGDSAGMLRRAMERLQGLSASDLLRSSLWRSDPVDCPPGSPPFLNAVVAFMPRAEETPESLLTKLQQIEKEFGRRPKRLINEPRPLDLDLIAFGGEVRKTKDLALPHPRAHLRRFVLAPLNEILPAYRLPGQEQAVSELLARLPEDRSVAKLA